MPWLRNVTSACVLLAKTHHLSLMTIKGAESDGGAHEISGLHDTICVHYIIYYRFGKLYQCSFVGYIIRLKKPPLICDTFVKIFGFRSPQSNILT